MSQKIRGVLQSHPVLAYFTLTYAISWMGALALVAPKLIHGQAVTKMDGLLMFPVMLLGPSLAGISLTWIIDGRSGLEDLFSRMRRIGLPPRQYAGLVIPPAVILGTLLCLKSFISPVFSPNAFFIGILFGIPAGLLEEIGWMGFAFPKMRLTQSASKAGISLGLLWGAWHIPVIDYLGTATPHGKFWLPYFLAFTMAMTAMRVLIVWMYTDTRSVALAQMMHVCSTGSLVVFSPNRVTAAKEAMWYAVYGAALWGIVALLLKIYGRNLQRGDSFVHGKW